MSAASRGLITRINSPHPPHLSSSWALLCPPPCQSPPKATSPTSTPHTPQHLSPLSPRSPPPTTMPTTSSSLITRLRSPHPPHLSPLSPSSPLPIVMFAASRGLIAPTSTSSLPALGYHFHSTKASTWSPLLAPANMSMAMAVESSRRSLGLWSPTWERWGMGAIGGLFFYSHSGGMRFESIRRVQIGFWRELGHSHLALESESEWSSLQPNSRNGSHSFPF